MVNNYLSAILMVLIVGCYGCQSTTIAEYKSIVLNEKSGLLKKKTIGELSIDVLCKPSAYSAIVEGGASLSKKKFQELQKEYANTVDFNIRIGPAKGNKNVLAYRASTKSAIENRIQYFAYKFKNDIRLDQAGTSFQPILCHFERSYDLTPYKNFTLSFPASALDEDYTLIINSEELGLSNLKFKFDKSKIDESPQLIF